MQLFPPLRVLLLVLGAGVLTFASSLIPRPVYEQAGLGVVRYGYPMPYLMQDLSGLTPSSFPTFVNWMANTAQPTALEWNLALVNVAFYMTAFALATVFFRPKRHPPNEP